jgi:hypothetical protein
MKRIVVSCFVLACIVGMTGVTRAAPGFNYGIDAAVTIPVSDLADRTGMGVGGFISAAFTGVPLFNITARVGYLWGLEEKENALQQIPVLFGIQYFFVPVVYAGAEFGPVFAKFKQDDSDEWQKDYGGSIGAGVKMGPLDARGAFFMSDLKHFKENLSFLLSVGYRF